MTVFPLLDQLRSVKPSLLAEDCIPLLGHDLSCFSWDALALYFKEIFSIPSLQFTLDTSEWKESDSLYTHFSSPRKVFCFEEDTLEGSLSLIFREEEFNTLFSLVFTGKTDPLHLIDDSLKSSFYWFLGATIAKGFSTVHVLPDYPLHFSLVDEESYTPSSSFTADVSFHFLETPFSIRLILSSSFLHALRKKESSFSFEELVKRKIAKKTEIPVSIEGGSVKLSYSLWETLEIGDILILDTCSSFEEKGRVLISALNIPFFRGMLKKEGVKILETPLNLNFRETHMEKDDIFEEDESNEESHDDLDFDAIEHSMIEDKEEVVEETPQEAPSLEDFNTDIPADLNDLEIEKPVEKIEDPKEALAAIKEALPEKHSVKETEAPQEKTLEELSEPKTPIEALKRAPIDIIVELACISMPIEKLLSLEAGNMLELDINPENTIHLTINGKKVAAGELLKIGDKVGVKLLEIY